MIDKGYKKTIIRTPWDSKVFGIDTYEIKVLSRKVLNRADKIRGHFTVKVDPIMSKRLLFDYNFYYCDTLIEPHCSRDRLIYHSHEKASVYRHVRLKDLSAISHGAFFGRFHRDFNIDKRLADLRYDKWLGELYKKGGVFGLMFDNKLVGFFGFSGNKIILHAIKKEYRSLGLAKYLWSIACKELFHMGHKEISSSISAYNIPALNLYASLGFKFRKPLDVYHRLRT